MVKISEILDRQGHQLESVMVSLAAFGELETEIYRKADELDKLKMTKSASKNVISAKQKELQERYGFNFKDWWSFSNPDRYRAVAGAMDRFDGFLTITNL
jgi:hypothetical protein